MEGIFDGRAVDGCFWCELLYPGAADCPRCGRRMRYQPAVMMSLDDLRQALMERAGDRGPADVGGHGPARQQRARRLMELLDMLHRFAPLSLELWSELGGPDMDALRSEYEALAAGGALARDRAGDRRG